MCLIQALVVFQPNIDMSELDHYLLCSMIIEIYIELDRSRPGAQEVDSTQSNVIFLPANCWMPDFAFCAC